MMLLRYLDQLQRARIETDALAIDALERCERRMRNLVFDPASIPPALPLIQLTLYGLPETRDRYERRIRGIMSMEALMHYDVTSRLHQIAAPPVVLLHGASGNLEDQRLTRLRLQPDRQIFKLPCHAARLPRGKMLVWEECGHLPYLEKPAQFNAVVDAFIREG